jgi:hypothetical protein
VILLALTALIIVVPLVPVAAAPAALAIVALAIVAWRRRDQAAASLGLFCVAVCWRRGSRTC